MNKEAQISYLSDYRQEPLTASFYTEGSAALAPSVSAEPDNDASAQQQGAEVISVDFVNRKKSDKKKKNFGGSEAFRLEYDPRTPEKALYDDIVSYLGEYRFQLPEYRFTQFYGADNILRSELGDPMVKVGEEGIKQRIADGESVDKVTADVSGLKKVQSILADAKDGDRIIYASPPDPEYGFTYGFMYDGRVEEIAGGEKQLHMRALRLENNPQLSQFNESYLHVSGSKYSFATPNEFIENPVHVTKQLSDVDINHILYTCFQFDSDANQQIIFQEVIAEMDPYIRKVIKMIQKEDDQQGKAMHALENYAIILKDKKEQQGKREVLIFSEEKQKVPDDFGNFMKAYGYQPPAVAGSCGLTAKGGRGGNDMFGTGSVFGFPGSGGEKYTGENAANDPNLCRCPEAGGAHFHCPGEGGEYCGKAIVVGKGIESCDCGAGKKC